MKGIQDNDTEKLNLDEILQVIRNEYPKTNEYKNAGNNQGWYLMCEERLVREYWQPIKATL